MLEDASKSIPSPRPANCVAPSSIPAARERLGPKPMQWLFEKCGRKWAMESAERHKWRGLKLFGIDGTSLRVPDSAANREHFGGHSGGAGRGQSGYPMVRAVALMALRSHLLAGFTFAPYVKSEQELAKDLWPLVPDDSLCIADRAFLSPSFLVPLAEGGANRHWMTRAKTNTRWRVLKKLGKGDWLVEMETSSSARKADPNLPPTWTARAVAYQRPGFKPQTILTSLTDPRRWPRSELAALYHERWEIELGFDEIKTEILEREESLRSKSPARVAQELWGMALLYNLVRLEMERIAALANVTPNRISFVTALRSIKDCWFWASLEAPGSIPKRLRKMRDEILRFVLPPRRSHRLTPRWRLTDQPKRPALSVKGPWLATARSPLALCVQLQYRLSIRTLRQQAASHSESPWGETHGNWNVRLRQDQRARALSGRHHPFSSRGNRAQRPCLRRSASRRRDHWRGRYRRHAGCDRLPD
jgi:Transposase DDE domain